MLDELHNKYEERKLQETADQGHTLLPLSEVVRIGAVNSEFFCRVFFPRTFRQPSAPFHSLMWQDLEDGTSRYVHLRCFRGSAKTTLLRAYLAKRIAYGISKTILYLGATEGHATRTLYWLRAQVEKNHLYANTFGLRPGMKWQEAEIQIERTIDDEVTWMLGLGMGSKGLRGINFDDYRPDLIVLDDIMNDEAGLSEDQMEKVNNTVFGAIKYSLAPRSEAANAMMCLLDTPISTRDTGSLCEKSSEWHNRTISCWTPETVGLPTEQQVSSWPQRYPSKELQADKEAAIRDNVYSKFAREMECILVNRETAAFKQEWIKEYTDEAPPGFTVIAIDPIPPPSPTALERGLRTKDYECILALRRSRGVYYVLDYKTSRGHEPNWTISMTLEMCQRWQAARIVPEAIMYQRTLEYLFRQEMSRRGIYWPVIPPKDDKRGKYHRILSTISGPLSQGVLLIRPEMIELREQIVMYHTPGMKDDVLDALSLGLTSIVTPQVDLGPEDYSYSGESDTYRPDIGMGCP